MLPTVGGSGDTAVSQKKHSCPHGVHLEVRGGRAVAVWMSEVKHRDPEISGLSNMVLGCCGYWRNDGEHRRVTEKAGSTAG